MRRYTKSARPLQLAGTIEVRTVRYGQLVQEHLSEIFNGDLSVLRQARRQTFEAVDHTLVKDVTDERWQQLLQYGP